MLKAVNWVNLTPYGTSDNKPQTIPFYSDKQATFVFENISESSKLEVDVNNIGDLGAFELLPEDLEKLHISKIPDGYSEISLTFMNLINQKFAVILEVEKKNIE